jgi:hypothetical protein
MAITIGVIIVTISVIFRPIFSSGFSFVRMRALFAALSLAVLILGIVRFRPARIEAVDLVVVDGIGQTVVHAEHASFLHHPDCNARYISSIIDTTMRPACNIILSITVTLKWVSYSSRSEQKILDLVANGVFRGI